VPKLNTRVNQSDKQNSVLFKRRNYINGKLCFLKMKNWVLVEVLQCAAHSINISLVFETNTTSITIRSLPQFNKKIKDVTPVIQTGDADRQSY